MGKEEQYNLYSYNAMFFNNDILLRNSVVQIGNNQF